MTNEQIKQVEQFIEIEKNSHNINLWVQQIYPKLKVWSSNEFDVLRIIEQPELNKKTGYEFCLSKARLTGIYQTEDFGVFSPKNLLTEVIY